VGRVEIIGNTILYLGDCKDILPTLKADALVTDPAYGINAARDRKSQKHGWRDYDAPGWDRERTAPELVSLAISRTQHAIIWGGNYFTDVLPPRVKRTDRAKHSVRGGRQYNKQQRGQPTGRDFRRYPAY